MFRSTDAGGSWSEVSPPWMRSLVVDPATPATLYGAIQYGAVGTQVFKLTDAGGSWASASTGLTSSSVVALVIHPSTPTTLFAGTLDGSVFRTTDAGGSWSSWTRGRNTSTGRPWHSIQLERPSMPAAPPVSGSPRRQCRSSPPASDRVASVARPPWLAHRHPVRRQLVASLLTVGEDVTPAARRRFAPPRRRVPSSPGSPSLASALGSGQSAGAMRAWNETLNS